MATFLAVISGVLAVGAVGYTGVALLACEVFDPESNLCGIVGVFLTGPLGAILGGIFGLRYRSPRGV